MAQLSLSSEDKLLLYCSRISMTEDIKHKIEDTLNEILDWGYIVECSKKQGISPLLYWNLKKVNSSKYVPSEVMEDLKKIYFSNLARNTLLYNELSKILTAFKEIGIDTIVLKGAFLAEEIYQNIGLRPMSDIDLLIKEEDLTKVKDELTKLMYSTKTFRTKCYERLQTVLSNELLFINKTKGIYIDLHWNILPPESPYKIKIIKLWENAKPIKIAGVETLMLAPEDLLQHLCLHLDNHINYATPATQSFKDYCDVAEVTRHYKEKINWSYLLQNSKGYGIETPIFQGLSIANKYFGAFVPENILSILEPAKFNNVKETFNELMQDNSNKKNQWEKVKFYKKLGEVNSAWDKLCLLVGYIFPSKEFMMHHYSIENKKRIYIYYLIHLRKVLQIVLPILWKLPHYILDLLSINKL